MRYCRRPFLVFMRVFGLCVAVVAVVLMLFVAYMYVYKLLVAMLATCQITVSLVLPLLSVLLCLVVILSRHPMFSLLALVGIFLCAVVIYLALGADYIAFVLLIVYVGAVAILFLFILMLLDTRKLPPEKQKVTQQLALGLSLCLSTILLIINVVVCMYFKAFAFEPLSPVNTKVDDLVYDVSLKSEDIVSIGSLYYEQVSLFFLITLILLVAMLGAIVLASVAIDQMRLSTNNTVRIVTPARDPQQIFSQCIAGPAP